MVRTRISATILAGALGGTAMAQAPDAACALPSEPEGISAALDAASHGSAPYIEPRSKLRGARRLT